MTENLQGDLISVIIPVYNVEKYLSQCIDSVVNQTYKNLEIILIDDGSTDSSLNICKTYASMDSRISVIHHENTGLACVRNEGIQIANGKYILWIDSDDFVSNIIVEHLYDNINKFEADISICDFTKGAERNYHFSDLSAELKCVDSREALNLIYKDSHYAFVMVASWAKLIKKSLYTGLKYPENKLFEDIYISHHLLNQCKSIVLSSEVLYYYYQGSESILGKKFYIKKLDYLEAFEERIHFFKGLGYDELAEKARVQYLHSLIWEYSRAKDILHNKKMVKHIKSEYRKFYSFGTFNEHQKNETKGYMFMFNISPWLVDFLQKVFYKLFRGKNK